MNSQDIVGTWRNAGQKTLNADGTLRSALPPTPGFIQYSLDGYMVVVTANQVGVSTADPSTMTAEEKARAASACIAYAGPFEVKDGTVYHHIEAGIFPAWIGAIRVRHASIEGKRLIYVTDPAADGSTMHIFWERV